MSDPTLFLKDDRNQLLAVGHDHSHVVVFRGPMSADYDESWQALMDYVRRRNMVLWDDAPMPESAFNPDYELRSEVYVVPQMRLLANDCGITRSYAQIRQEILGATPPPAPPASAEPSRVRPLSVEPSRFLAHGDDDQVVVLHGLLVDEDDPLWPPVREHLKQHDMDVVVRAEGAHPAFNMGQAVAWWFGTAAFRARLAEGDAERFRAETFGE